MRKKITRKQFLQAAGLATLASLFGQNSMAEEKLIKFDHLAEDQKEFLDRYAQWAKQFATLAAQQESNNDNLDYSKELVRLSEQSELFNNQLETYLKDENFRYCWQSIINKVSQKIK